MAVTIIDTSGVGLAALAAANISVAGIQAASTAGSWVSQLAVTALVAAAQVALLELQKDHYDEIAEKQRDLVEDAIDDYRSCVTSLESQFLSSYPDVPDAALYVPVDSCAEQVATIACNIQNLDSAYDYAEKLREYHMLVETARLTVMNATWVADMSLYTGSISSLLRGELPTDDVADILSDVNEQACLRGSLGNVCRETSRSLGLSRLRAQEMGRKGMDQWLESMNRNVSPIARLVDMRELMQNPGQRIALALTQAQLIQNSLQNAMNLSAQVPLGKTALLQAKIQKCITIMSGGLSKANLVNTYVPNYAAALTPAINQFAGALGSMMTGGGNTGATTSQGGKSPMYTSENAALTYGTGVRAL